MSAEPKVRIESLTEAQIAKIPEYREHWIKVGGKMVWENLLG
jgi:hypothetical protein